MSLILGLTLNVVWTPGRSQTQVNIASGKGPDAMAQQFSKRNGPGSKSDCRVIVARYTILLGS